MNKSMPVTLITEYYTQNEYGVLEPSERERNVYARVSSVSSNEWFEGGRNGLNPQFRFTMFSHDYNNEKIIVMNDVRYTIYRTYYKTVDEIELYAELKVGNEFGQESQS